MILPQTVQLPLYEPIYVNNQISPVWAMFFDRIAKLLNQSQLSDLMTLMQLASQLPDQSRQGQMSIDVGHLLNQFSATLVMHSEESSLGSVPIPQHEMHGLQPLQAVFLCPSEMLAQVDIPQIEVITP